MQALVLKHPGTDQQPVLKEIPVPQPGPGEVLVRIHAAALNHRDLFWLRGTMGKAPAFIMGADGAGVIAAVGEGAAGWSPGDPVIINPGLYCSKCRFCLGGKQHLCPDFMVLGGVADGTLAEYVRVPASNLAAKPAHLDFTQAAALPMAVGTAWQTVVAKGQLQPGETVLIHGVGGGVALVALQIAAAMGARVIVTSSSAEKLARAAAMGAAAGINYQEEDVLQRVRELTDGAGADLVLDGIGKETLVTSARALGPEGRVVRFGAVTGGTQILTRDLPPSLITAGMASQPEFDAAIRFVAATRLVPAVSHLFPLADWEAAFQTLSGHQQFGKVAVQLA